MNLTPAVRRVHAAFPRSFYVFCRPSLRLSVNFYGFMTPCIILIVFAAFLCITFEDILLNINIVILDLDLFVSTLTKLRLTGLADHHLFAFLNRKNTFQNFLYDIKILL